MRIYLVGTLLALARALRYEHDSIDEYSPSYYTAPNSSGYYHSVMYGHSAYMPEYRPWAGATTMKHEAHPPYGTYYSLYDHGYPSEGYRHMAMHAPLRPHSQSYHSLYEQPYTSGYRTEYPPYALPSPESCPLPDGALVKIRNEVTGYYLGKCTGCGSSRYNESASRRAVSADYTPADMERYAAGATEWYVRHVGDKCALMDKRHTGYLSICENCWKSGRHSGAIFIQSAGATVPPRHLFWGVQVVRPGVYTLRGGNGKWLGRCVDCGTGSNSSEFPFAYLSTPHSPDAKWLIEVVGSI